MEAAWSITICESGENHTGMEIIGERAKEGFTCDELKEIEQVFTLDLNINGLQVLVHLYYGFLLY